MLVPPDDPIIKKGYAYFPDMTKKQMFSLILHYDVSPRELPTSTTLLTAIQPCASHAICTRNSEERKVYQYFESLHYPLQTDC